MPRKGNPISVRLDLNRSSDSSWFSDYYYAKFLYQDVNPRSYFGSIRPPTRLTFGFRLGRCIIIHFPKRAFIHFFLPRRPRRLKRRDKSRPGKEKGRWWAFGKVGPIGCLHSSDKPCRLLLGDVWNGELTKNRPRLRNKKRSIKRKIYPRSNLNSDIQSRSTRRIERNILFLNVISEAIPFLLSLFFLFNPLVAFCDSGGAEQRGLGGELDESTSSEEEVDESTSSEEEVDESTSSDSELDENGAGAQVPQPTGESASTNGEASQQESSSGEANLEERRRESDRQAAELASMQARVDALERENQRLRRMIRQARRSRSS